MTPDHSIEQILTASISSYDDYCVGYPGHGGYLTAVVMGQGAFPKMFSHAGSDLLDSTVAYDRAETNGTYLGQINMITVSSFCGPQGLIWGYDIARQDLPPLPLLTNDGRHQFAGSALIDGSRLREAARLLFGTRDRRRFPLLPGTHVPCAGKFRFFDGPAWIYSAVAIGIPEDRGAAAVLFMEDVGQLMLVNGAESLEPMRHRILQSLAHSVTEVGRNQGVLYQEILLDVSLREIHAGEIGCALVAVPYFHLARNAYDEVARRSPNVDETRGG
jgi:histidine decarboxylase